MITGPMQRLGAMDLTPARYSSGSLAQQWTMGAHGFCMKQFFATDAAFRSVLLLFNLVAEFQRAAGLPGYREPATIRTQVLTCGAILGRAGRREVVHLSESWGGLKTRIPLLQKILACEFPISPKLDPVLQI
jgi:hypothetical protein